MSERINSNQFAEKLETILRDYGDKVFDIAEASAKTAARSAVQELKATRHVITGRYARGWSHRTENRGTVESATYVYNRETPGLTHLLNKSHATGRYRRGHYTGDHHFDDAERRAADKFLNGIKGKL